jgi:23S rRNA (adenine2503-C2)-methyltransferase
MNLAELERHELEDLVERHGSPRFHGGQAFEWIQARGVTDPAAMTNLPARLRQTLAEEHVIEVPVVEERHRSEDGTTKFRLRLADGRAIESVFIPDTPAQTFCVSTQVGCAMACAFCLTGKMGLVRHLSASEIVGQARLLARETQLTGSAFNIVLMGMGEPLHNYDATMKALRIMADPKGLALPPRRITLSTVGLVPALERLREEPIMPNLAISLHATTDEQRTALVPLNKRYDLDALIDACKRFPVARRRRITFEYVMLAGVNDSVEDARRLVRILAGVKGKVNLLPLNEAPGIPFRRPTDAQVDAFARVLSERGMMVSVRRSRGRDIRAACGQLIVEGAKPSAGQILAGAMPGAGSARPA